MSRPEAAASQAHPGPGRLPETRVLLTGSSGGIGQAAARLLVHSGASVMLVGRSPAKLAAQARDLLRECDATRPRVEWHAADLTRAEELDGVSRAARAWGCNVLVHNAGMPGFGRIESVDADTMAQVLNINLLTPMLLTQRLLPHLRAQPRAQVVCIGSVLGRLGLPGYSVYSASKFGLRGFAEALRRELGDTSVRVKYLGPRSTDTGFNSVEAAHYNKSTGTSVDAPEVVAKALVQVLQDDAPERFLGFPEKLAVRLNGLVPRLLDGAFEKHRRSLPPRPAQAPDSDSDSDAHAADEQTARH